MVPLKVHAVSIRMETALREKRLQQHEGDETIGRLPPVVPDTPFDEAAFLAEMAEFERQMDAQKMVSVYERIGSPTILPPDALSEHEIGPALDELIDCFIANNICIDFFGDYTPAEMYRAIVEDILPEEIVELTAPGWVSHIPYTTPANQIKQDVAWFVSSVLHKEKEALLGERPTHRPRYDERGLIQTREAFERDLLELWSRLGPIQFVDVEVTELTITDVTATAVARIHWHTEMVGGCGCLQASFQLEELQDVSWAVLGTSLIGDMLRYL